VGLAERNSVVPSCGATTFPAVIARANQAAISLSSQAVVQGHVRSPTLEERLTIHRLRSERGNELDEILRSAVNGGLTIETGQEEHSA
jgi:hypothetical protein